MSFTSLRRREERGAEERREWGRVLSFDH